MSTKINTPVTKAVNPCQASLSASQVPLHSALTVTLRSTWLLPSLCRWGTWSRSTRFPGWEVDKLRLEPVNVGLDGAQWRQNSGMCSEDISELHAGDLLDGIWHSLQATWFQTLPSPAHWAVFRVVITHPYSDMLKFQMLLWECPIQVLPSCISCYWGLLASTLVDLRTCILKLWLALRWCNLWVFTCSPVRPANV